MYFFSQLTHKKTDITIFRLHMYSWKHAEQGEEEISEKYKRNTERQKRNSEGDKRNVEGDKRNICVKRNICGNM